MKLDQEELEQLAHFFAKRFTVSLDPAEQDTNTVDKRRADWVRRLTLAQSKGRLQRLAKKIAKIDPSDANLQEAALLLGLRKISVLPFVLLAVVLVLGIFYVGSNTSDTTAPEEEAPEVVAKVELNAVQSVPSKELAEAEEPVPQTQAVEELSEVAAPPKSIPEADVPEPVSVAPPSPAANRRHCNRLPADMVVYWYAGEDTPGSVGDVIDISRPMNAREDYPDRHNQYNARAAIQCILVPGERVKLTQEPLFVPGDRYWVPLRASDMVD